MRDGAGEGALLEGREVVLGGAADGHAQVAEGHAHAGQGGAHLGGRARRRSGAHQRVQAQQTLPQWWKNS